MPGCPFDAVQGTKSSRNHSPHSSSPSFDVFDETGRFINRITIEGEWFYPRGVEIRNKAFWKIETDKDGFYRVVNYRISE